MGRIVTSNSFLVFSRGVLSIKMPETFYIIDGHAHLYASYFAIRALSSPSGEPTNAVFGMTSVLLKVLRDCQPDYLVVAFDPPGPVFRHEIHAEYKANRPEMPQDLRSQVGRIQEVCRAIGITPVVVEGFEADDVIGTLTGMVTQAGKEVVICSKDKDLEQLLGPGVTMYDTRKDKVFDEQWLLAEKGIRPDQVADVLALAGDATDNIPGVEGILSLIHI